MAYNFQGVMDPDWVFFNIGSTAACLKTQVTTPADRDKLNASTIQGPIDLKDFLNSAVGRTSVGLEEGFILSCRVETSCNDTG